ncbi:SCO7613 C-terminal domain-containing membrane protein [Catenuloplanes atrovinosus]|uniref:DUF2157 domain-containing protein n=1 Tax=Catenuloplanes atrovinosus TaxID=137266 RepID=A0AAE3YYN8_9ACTN|nr:hypothetical protein [Catenuloplanes atrovinosus]MDR7281005.1 hypothetical protein [Catenuloplanes atrovinosus]
MQSEVDLLAPEYPCPWCGTTATLAGGCPGCGRAPNPVAAEVIGLDGRIAALAPLVETARAELESARRVYDERSRSLRGLQDRRNGLLARIHAERVTVPAGPETPAAPTPPERPSRPETSTRTVQNVLFILGGLLLGTAAIVFTTIAWATFGLAGRAAILATVTALTLAAPLVALRRKLTATAETFAALGLLLILLDGYAAWYVNLLGVAALDPERYAGVVALVAALVAAGYGWATGLTGPRLAAMLLAQPVLPLVLPRTGAYGTALVLAGVAAIDLAAARFPVPVRPAARTDDPAVRGGLRTLAWVLFGGWLVAASAAALFALVPEDGVPAIVAPTALLAVGLLLVVASLVAGVARLQAVASGVLVVLVAIAATRPAVEYGDRFWLVTGTAVLTVLGLAVWLVLPRLPEPIRPGPRTGALIVLCGTYLALATVTAVAVLVTIAQAGETGRIDAMMDWQVPLALVTLPLVIAPLLGWYTPRVFVPANAEAPPAPATGKPWRWGGGWRGWHDPVIVAAAMGVVSLPVGFTMPMAAAAALDLAAGAVLLLTAARERFARSVVVRSVAGASLVLVALAMSAGRPRIFAVLLPAAVLLGVAVALTAYRRNPRLGRLTLGVALTAVPFAAVAVLAGTSNRVGDPLWGDAAASAASRLAFAAGAVVLVATAAVRRWWPAYLGAATVASGLVVIYVGLPPDAGRDPRELYAAGALLLTAVAAYAFTAEWGRALLALTGLPLAGAVLLHAGDAILTVVVAPYTWLGRGWSERPTGTGLSPDALTLPTWSQAVAVALLVPVVFLAVLTAGRTRRWALLGAAATAALTLLTGLAAAGAPWPAIPAVALTAGLAALLAAAWVPRSAALLVPVGIVLKGAGLAGASPRPATTLAALGLSLIVGVVIGVTGRGLRSRLSGWLGAVLAAVALAGTTGAAADLPLRVTALAVLGVAVAALALGALLRRPRPAEATAVEVAAHATAVVAFLLVLGVDLRYAAVVALLWSIALGVRAIPGPWRWALGLIAAGWLLTAWWLLLGSTGIGVWEAYTLPTALVAAVVGLLAARARPALSSWRAYTVCLVAALLPSLAAVLLGDASWQRRLLLGLGAIALVLGGSIRRRQSPVILGGGTLLVLSVTEVARVWDLLPRWLPFAIGGLVLLTLAITYERRLRDLTRLRAAVDRMT